MPDDESPEHPSPPPESAPLPCKPPLLDYPSLPPPAEPEGERWSEVFRALLVVFGFLGLLFFISFGVCGVLARGCG
jgi:hypothetical protein